MHDVNDYADGDTIANCRRSFARVYPEFAGVPIGVSQDWTCLVFRCDFPDGTFWFRVTENSVSGAYGSPEDADRP